MAPDTNQAPAPAQVAHPVQFASFARTQSDGVGGGNLDLLRDVGMRVTVELGRTHLPIREVLPDRKSVV